MDPFFKDPETAAVYEPAPGFGVDRTVTVIGLFSGDLSKIPLAAADKAFAQGTNLFVKKTAVVGVTTNNPEPAASADEKAAAPAADAEPVKAAKAKS